MGKTTIEWTAGDDGSAGKTWNPTRGCSIESPGCERCYAMAIAARFSGPGKPFEGFARFSPKRRVPQWTGKLGLVLETLGAPLTWKKPRRIFVNSMSDLFHEELTNEQIAAVFGVMAACPQHTFQVLTKRARRMREWLAWVQAQSSLSRYSGAAGDSPAEVVRGEAIPYYRHPNGSMPPGIGRKLLGYDNRWPLPNVWLGVSVESQEYADARVPALLATPAAVRFVSYEPALGPVDFERFLKWTLVANDGRRLQHPDPDVPSTGGTWERCLDWVIVGGESGNGARPFDVAWAESVVRQCREAGVACFVKQLGARAYMSPEQEGATGYELGLRSAKGGDMAEWPAAIRVRQFPATEAPLV